MGLLRWIRGRRATPVAVVGFYSTEAERAALQQTFDAFEYPEKRLCLYRAEREGELHSLSKEIGDLPIACVHPEYSYPASYLEDLAGPCDPRADAIWTADAEQRDGRLGDGANPDAYRSLIPSHVFRLLFSRVDRHIAFAGRGQRSRNVELRRCETAPVQVNGALPYPVHEPNGLYGLVDYGHRLDRRCIEAYLKYHQIPADRLGWSYAEFLDALTPIQRRHLIFFLNTNIVGERGVRYIEEQIDLARLESAIDVGSGYGGLVKALCGRGCRATGLEINSTLADMARINLAGDDAELIVGDFLSEPLPPASYDLVTMTDVIEHVADVELAIARTGEVLRDGGHAYIKVPNYRFIDYVREDSHTGLFAITLLRHDPASAYLRAVRDKSYSVGEYYEYDHYIRTCDKHGLTLVRADNVESALDETDELLGKLRAAYARWRDEIAIDGDMKAMIVDRVESYLMEIEQQRTSETFGRDYLASHWNLFVQKRS